jgi:L-ribulokinase
MSIVAGVDFGTLSVRVSLFDSDRGRLGSGAGEYALHRTPADPNHATQSHADHLAALEKAFAAALASAAVDGAQVEALAIDTTGSSVIAVDEKLRPLGDYYLWCDHRSWREALAITEAARAQKLEAIAWCGGAYSSEWGFAKVLHWLRHNPDRRDRMATALEHCDYIAAVLCGITDPAAVPRSVCAMGHKWMYNAGLGGLPPDSFFRSVDPLLGGVRDRIQGRWAASDAIAGTLAPEWAARLGLRAGIPIPTGALDAHWDAVGAGIRAGDVVNVIGTSTCIMAITGKATLVPGLSGVVQGSIHPKMAGMEAGLSAMGDLFDAIARRANTTVAGLSKGLESYRAGQTGLLRLAWDNGDRTVLVNPELGGMTFGWNLQHTARDEFFAAIEGTAFHTRVIFDRMEEYGVPVHRVIHGGGIPQRNEVLNRVYANVLGKPVLVPQGDVTSVGSAVFAFLAAGTFQTVEAAQAALCPAYRTIEPDATAAGTYEELYGLFRRIYFAFGDPDGDAISMTGVLARLRAIGKA